MSAALLSAALYLRQFSSKSKRTLSFLRGEVAIAKTLFRDEYGTFAAQLRKMRLAAGLIQDMLAARMQVSQRFVSRCESCERRVDLFELLDWCHATEVSFLTFVEEMKLSLPAHLTERTLGEGPVFRNSRSIPFRAR